MGPLPPLNGQASLEAYILNGQETVTLEYARERIAALFTPLSPGLRTCYLIAGNNWGRKFRIIEDTEDKKRNSYLAMSCGLIACMGLIALLITLSVIHARTGISEIEIRIGMIVSASILGPLSLPLIPGAFFSIKRFLEVRALRREELDQVAVQDLASQILLVAHQHYVLVRHGTHALGAFPMREEN